MKAGNFEEGKTVSCVLQQSLGMRAVDFFPSYIRRMLGWLVGSEDAQEAVVRLEHEPIFCVETGATVPLPRTMGWQAGTAAAAAGLAQAGPSAAQTALTAWHAMPRGSAAHSWPASSKAS